MKIVRIAIPFVFSAVLFILSYLSINEEGYFWLVFLSIGIVVALFGIILATRD